MIQRVCEQAQKAQCLSHLVVATDDARIAEHVHSFGGQALLTSPDHPSGTDRCQEVVSLLSTQGHGPWDYVINIQGDEPFLNPQQIDELTPALDGSSELVTQVMRVTNTETLLSTGAVKVTLNRHHEALYFSRSPIPFVRNVPQEEWVSRIPIWEHVGLYAYRTDILQAISQLPPSFLEQTESLEQLRWLEAGYRIRVVETTFESFCIDTEEDLEKARKLTAIS